MIIIMMDDDDDDEDDDDDDDDDNDDDGGGGDDDDDGNGNGDSSLLWRAKSRCRPTVQGHNPALQYNIFSWQLVWTLSINSRYTRGPLSLGASLVLGQTDFLTKQLHVAGNMHEPTHDTWHQHKASY